MNILEEGGGGHVVWDKTYLFNTCIKCQAHIQNDIWY